MHLLLAIFVAGGFGTQSAPMKTVQPVNIISASLVELKKVKTISKPVRKSKPKKPASIVKKKSPAVPLKKELAKPMVVDTPAVVEKLAPESALIDNLLADEDQLMADDREQDEAARYGAAMKAVITNQWNRPPSARNNMEVLLSIRLVPNGDVVSVSIKKSSGNAAFDRSASLAVEKVGRFDMLQGMSSSLFEKHFRNIEITFRPEDLRL